MSPTIDRLIEHDIDTLNDHLPETRVNVLDLSKMEGPHFITRCGERSVFKRDEIDWIRAQVPEVFHENIRLPIVILRRLDYGLGIYTVAGNKYELFMIHRILGYVDLEWDNFADWKPVEHLARLQVQVLRKRLPSTTSIGIVFAAKEKTRDDQVSNH